MPNTHVEAGQQLASRAILCERHGDFQRARNLYLDAASSYAKAARSSSLPGLQVSYQKLTDIYLGKARQLRGRQSNQITLHDSDNFGIILSEKSSPNPFRLTSEIQSIADRCISNKSKTDLEGRARAIFDWLDQNIKYGGKKRGRVGYRRADEVVRTSEGVCGEDTYPYIVMLRYAGLEARFMLVYTDCHGQDVFHACARISAPREFSSDVAYHMYDVQAASGSDHQRIKVLPDEEVLKNEDAVAAFKSWRG